MTYLQLVLAGLSLRRWVQEVDSENLWEIRISHLPFLVLFSFLEKTTGAC